MLERLLEDDEEVTSQLEAGVAESVGILTILSRLRAYPGTVRA